LDISISDMASTYKSVRISMLRFLDWNAEYKRGDEETDDRKADDREADDGEGLKGEKSEV
jgi:hypothetical protein